MTIKPTKEQVLEAVKTLMAFNGLYYQPVIIGSEDEDGDLHLFTVGGFMDGYGSYEKLTSLEQFTDWFMDRFNPENYGEEEYE